ncbi:MAG TPA: cysteine dioxygenase family protein [bacterium]|nr:cysteine dioxygenase family protein [bacterium]
MSETELSPSMKLFVDDVRKIVREGGGEETVTARVAERMQPLLREGDALGAQYRVPRPGTYALYPVWVEPGGSFSIAAAVWDVGAGTPVHDHGTWGVIGIVEGVEREARYLPTLVDGTVKFKQVEERDLAERRVIVCCTSDRDIHRVRCGSAVPCVGIHVYGADIGAIERHAYDPDTGDVRTFVSGWTVPQPDVAASRKG